MNEAQYLQELQVLQDAVWPVGTRRALSYPHGEQPLTGYLRTWARLQPEVPALDFYGLSLSYAELDDLSDRWATTLSELGIGAGDRVAVYMPNCPQLHIAFYGTLKLGAVYVPISPLAKALELDYQLKDSSARVLICYDQLMPAVRAARGNSQLEHVFATSLSELLPAAPPLPLPDILKTPKLSGDDFIDFYPALRGCNVRAVTEHPQLDDIAALNYTGGTTGLPKGCIHTHGDMLYTCASYLSVSNKFDPNSTVLNFLPEFWIAGENSGLLFPVFSGCRLVLLARWDAITFMKAIQHYKVSHCSLLVDNAAEVLELPQRKDFDLSSLRVSNAISFVKKLTPAYRRRWLELTGSTLIESGFGLTETNTCDTFVSGLHHDDFDLKSAPTFVGLPVPGTEFKVCDFESGELLPLGSDGQLCIRSPSLFKGYWNRPEASAEVIRDGWLLTGDLGRITKQGFILYLGRRKEMIKVKGMSVFPSELEAMLGQHPAVHKSAVIARPDEKSGQRPVAFIVLKPNSSETVSSLLTWCKEVLAEFKVPDIRLVEQLPITTTGKVKKDELEKLL